MNAVLDPRFALAKYAATAVGNRPGCIVAHVGEGRVTLSGDNLPTQVVSVEEWQASLRVALLPF